MTEQENDVLKNTQLGLLVSSTLHKLENISDHHVKERRKHFRITNIIVVSVSVLLLIIALINIFYLYGFYKDTMRIIKTTHELDETVVIINNSMKSINHRMGKFDQHMTSMQGIYQDIDSMAATMPIMHNSISSLEIKMKDINKVMQYVNRDIATINFYLTGMTQKVSGLGVDMYRIAKPVGMFNGVLP